MTSPTTTAPPRVFDPLPLHRSWAERIPPQAAVLGLVTAVALSVSFLVPAPYAVRMPGPTVDTLGEQDGTQLITIPDSETYPSTGELRLTTVSVMGGPGYPVGIGNVLRGLLNPTVSVVPRESVFPANQSREEADQASQAQMTSSQENATAAALEALGYDVPAELAIAGVQADSGADGVVAEGDLLVSLGVAGEEAEEISTFSGLADALEAIPPGTEVELGVLRDGEPEDLSLVTGDDGAGGSLLGVLIDPEFDFPVEVDIAIANIGGSSAGTMFALGIMDKLTPGDATGGHVIAGTGTMDMAGEVGAIGGIVQKMNGSLRDGAEYFLAPAANCGEVVGNVPDGLQVVRIETLDEAWEAVQAIGTGTAEGLPTCE